MGDFIHGRFEGARRDYIDSLAADFCRYMSPSSDAGVFAESSYQLDGSPKEMSEAIFTIGVIHSEILRARRSADTSLAKLACEVIAFETPDDVQVDHEGLFYRPHANWRRLYTQKGLVYGKFSKGSTGTAITGQGLPVAPTSFLAIRSAMPKKDVRFFMHKDPERIPELEAAADNGELISHLPSYVALHAAVRACAGQLSVGEVTAFIHSDLNDVGELA